MTRPSQPQLSESWATVEDTGQGASYVDIQRPPRRSPRKQTPVDNINEPATGKGMDNSSMSSEPSLVMPSIEQPRHSPYFNPLPNDTSTPGSRGPKRKKFPGDTTSAILGRAAGNGARQRGRPRDQPQRRQHRKRQQHDPYADHELHQPQLFEGIMKLIWPIMKLLWQIFTHTLEFVAPWMTIIIGVWVIFGFSYFSINFAFLSVSNALSPVCNIPVVAWYWPGYCGPRSSPPSAPKEFEEVIELQAAFEEVLSSSTSDVINSLPRDISNSVFHLNDLRHSVRVSQLPSKNELVLELEGFEESASNTSSKLDSFTHSIGRAVDKIITTNRWTLRKLDSIANSDAERGLLEKLRDNIMSPFKPRLTRYDEVLEQYLINADVIEEQIRNLILEAQALVSTLRSLDDQLDTIAFVTKRDGVEVSEARDEILSSLWTFFGGNKHELRQQENKLVLIRNLSTYRRLAVAHVLATIRKLESIQYSLRGLRQRIMEPGFDVGRQLMPLEWHIYNIQLGLDRLAHQKQESDQARKEVLGRYGDGKVGRSDESRMIEGTAK